MHGFRAPWIVEAYFMLSMIVGAITIPAGVLWLGWYLAHHLHWM